MNATVQNDSRSRPPIFADALVRSTSVFNTSEPVLVLPKKKHFARKGHTLPHCEMEFYDFGLSFTFQILKIEGDPADGEIRLRMELENNVFQLVLSGQWSDDEGLVINNYGLTIVSQDDKTKSIYSLKTFWALLSLSVVNVAIPVLSQQATMSFETNLKEISELLVTRQLMFRLMVIEKTCDVEFLVPQFIDGSDVESAAYCYHSILDRKFEWPSNPARGLGETYTANVFRDLFDYSIDLGLQRFSVLKPGNFEIESITTPTLPANSFDASLSGLIAAEEALDSAYFNKYTNSFSNAFEGLADEQIGSLTERPELGPEAFNF